MPKRLMTEDEYAAWQQNAKKRLGYVPGDAGAGKRLLDYVEALKSTPEQPRCHSGRKLRKAKRQNGG